MPGCLLINLYDILYIFIFCTRVAIGIILPFARCQDYYFYIKTNLKLGVTIKHWAYGRLIQNGLRGEGATLRDCVVCITISLIPLYAHVQ